MTDKCPWWLGDVQMLIRSFVFKFSLSWLLSLPSFWLLIFIFCSVVSPLSVWTFHFPVRHWSVYSTEAQSLCWIQKSKNVLQSYTYTSKEHLSLSSSNKSFLWISNGSQRNLILRYLAFSFDYLLHTAVLNCLVWVALKKSCLFCSFGSSVLLQNKGWESDMR